VSGVLGDVAGEDLERTADESDHAIGVATGPPAVHGVEPCRQTAQDLLVVLTAGQLDEVLRNGVQPEDTGAALARALVGHVRGDARGLGNSTGRGRDGGQNPGAHGAPDGS
jgi:hypothetical protein